MSGVGDSGTNYIPSNTGLIAFEDFTTLTNGSSISSSWIDCSVYASVGVRIAASGTGSYTIYFSADGITNHSTITYEYYGSSSQYFFTPKFFDVGAKFCKIVFTNNSGSDYSSSLVQLLFSPSTKTVKVGRNRSQPLDVDCIPVRLADELDVMRGLVQGEYIISKHARNPDIDGGSTPEDIWNGGGTYTGFPETTPELFQIVCASANDTAAGTGAQAIRVFYLDENKNMFDSSGQFLYFDAELNGGTLTTAVTGARIWRAKVTRSGSGRGAAGDITLRWATTTSAVFAVMPSAYSQTNISNFTIPLGYTGYLKRFSATMDDNTSNSGEMAIRVIETGSNTDRYIRSFALATDNRVSIDVYGGEKFSELTDICFTCLSISNNNGTVTVDYDLHLVKD